MAGTTIIHRFITDLNPIHTEWVLVRAAEAVRGVCRPIDDKRGTAEYRIRIAGVIFKRTVAAALARAQT